MRIFFLLVFGLNFSGAQAQYQFTVEGTAPAIFNNKKIYFLVRDNFSEDNYEITDSATVKNNIFLFKGRIKKPSEWARLSTNAKEIKGFFYLVVDHGVNTVRIHPLAPKTPLYKNKLSNSEVVNSASNKVLRSIDSLTNYYYQAKGRPAAENKYRIRLSKEHNNELRAKILDILKANPTLYYSLIHTFQLIKTTGAQKISVDQAQDVLSSLSDELQQSALGQEMHQYITKAKSTHPGRAVPVFALKTNTDSSFSSSSMLGKPYILAFGATWCKPCKEKIPYLNQLQAKYKSKDLNVVYVNLDEKVGIWKKQIDTYKMSRWINVSEGVTWEESEMVKLFNVGPIPFYLIIDKTGKIVYNHYQDYNFSQIEESIKKL
jgi:thiol-disulfide isomerase/thioredoxin